MNLKSVCLINLNKFPSSFFFHRYVISLTACMPAAYLALEDVNNQKDLLPDFQLTLHSNDSEVRNPTYIYSVDFYYSNTKSDLYYHESKLIYPTKKNPFCSTTYKYR